MVDLAAALAADPVVSSAYPNMLFELDGLGEVSAGTASEGIVTDDAVWNVGWALRYSADNKATEYDEAGQLIYCADAPLTDSGQLDYESLIAQDPSNPTPAEVEAEWRLPARWAYDAINLPQAWAVLDSELGTEPGAGVTVGIFDSAIYTDHEDLPEIATTQQDDVDWLETSHATRVAGIIGARANNGTGQYGGTVGVAYGSSLVSISTGDPSVEERADLAAEGSGLESAFQYVYALTELVQSGSKVINCSNGLPLEDYIEPANNAQSDDHQWALDAIEQSNEMIADTLSRLLDSGYDFVICKASGNYNSVDDLEFNAEETVGVEGGQNAALDVLSGIDDERLRSRIIVVGAVEKATPDTYRVAAYSAGGDRVDVVAPGSYVYSPSPTVPNWQSQEEKGILDQLADLLTGTEKTVGNGYWSGYGTSFAAPLVSGTAAMVWGANPNLTGDQVKEIICSTATNMLGYDLSNGEQESTTAFDATKLYGMLDAEAAVRAALDWATEPAGDGEGVSADQSESAFPVGEFSYVAPAGGYRGSVSIDAAGLMTLTEFSSGTGAGTTSYYQMAVDTTVTTPEGVTAYTCVPTGQEGESWQMIADGNVPTGTFTVTDSRWFSYDAATDSLTDVSSLNVWVRSVG